MFRDKVADDSSRAILGCPGERLPRGASRRTGQINRDRDASSKTNYPTARLLLE